MPAFQNAGFFPTFTLPHNPKGKVERNLRHFGIKNVEDLPNSAELRSVDLPQPESEKENDEQLSLSEVAKDSENESESTENEDEKG